MKVDFLTLEFLVTFIFIVGNIFFAFGYISTLVMTNRSHISIDLTIQIQIIMHK